MKKRAWLQLFTKCSLVLHVWLLALHWRTFNILGDYMYVFRVWVSLLWKLCLAKYVTTYVYQWNVFRKLNPCALYCYSRHFLFVLSGTTTINRRLTLSFSIYLTHVNSLQCVLVIVHVSSKHTFISKIIILLSVL